MAAQVTRFETAGDFLDDVGERLYRCASINNLMLGICERLVVEPDAYKNPFFAVVHDAPDCPLLAAVMTPPQNLILAEGVAFEEGVPPVVDYLRAEGIQPPGVIGPVALAESFFETWKAAAGVGGEVTMYQRVYELRQVYLPKLPSGHFRVALSEDVPLIANWIQAFEAEALGKEHPLKIDWAERFVQKGVAFVWEDDGRPVAMAMKARTLKHSSTVNAVYTPPERRRKGYATALVARLSQYLLEMGYEFVSLFTDLENPMSNSIYQKIGYRPVADFRSYKFILES